MEVNKEKNILQTFVDELKDYLGTNPEKASHHIIMGLQSVMVDFRSGKFSDIFKVMVHFNSTNHNLMIEYTPLTDDVHYNQSELEGKEGWLTEELEQLYQTSVIAVKPLENLELNLDKTSFEDEDGIATLNLYCDVVIKEDVQFVTDDFIDTDELVELDDFMEITDEEIAIQREYEEDESARLAYEARYQKEIYNPHISHHTKHDALLEVLGFFDKLYDMKEHSLYLITQLNLPLHLNFEESTRLNDLANNSGTAVAIVEVQSLKPMLLVNQSLNPMSQVIKAYEALHLYHQLIQKRFETKSKGNMILAVDRNGNIIYPEYVKSILNTNEANDFANYVYHKYLY